jgi:hypothetical protein
MKGIKERPDAHGTQQQTKCKRAWHGMTPGDEGSGQSKYGRN